MEGHLIDFAQGEGTLSPSPADVLRAAYGRWGVGCLDRLSGNYSLAIFDVDAGRLVLSRDAAGTKPLYYSVGNVIVFGASAAEVLRASGQRAIASPRALWRYLQTGRTGGTEETLFQGVGALSAGHRIEVSRPDRPVVSSGQAAIESQTTADARPLAEAAEELRTLVLRVVGAQWSEGAAVALSGGLDSSGILSAARTSAGTSAPLRAVSFDHDHPALPEAWNERAWAELAANETGARLRLVRLSSAEIPVAMSAIFGIQGFPFASPVVLAQSELFRQAAESGIRVVLSGHGPDSMFGGGTSHIVARACDLLRTAGAGAAWSFLGRAAPYADRSRGRLAASSLAELLQAGRPGWAAHRPAPWASKRWFRERIAPDREAPAAQPVDTLRRVVMEQLFHSVLPTSMLMEERNASAHGLENRSPYLVAPMLRFAGTLAAELLVSDAGETRAVLRGALAGMVPAPILARKVPVGFAVPALPWLRELRPWADARIRDLRSLPFFEDGAARSVWADLEGGHGAAWKAAFCAWRWITLLEWVRANDVEFA
jgi:asparagine synthase (glutamine-hydrolysing)